MTTGARAGASNQTRRAGRPHRAVALRGVAAAAEAVLAPARRLPPDGAGAAHVAGAEGAVRADVIACERV